MNKLIEVCVGEMSRPELQKTLGLKGRMNFKRGYLDPALEELLERFRAIGNGKYPGLQAEIEGLADDLEEMFFHDVFKQVSRPELLPLNSPVLQRKEGYRQVLRAWMLFELAAKLSWAGGDDVYAGGKRDAATNGECPCWLLGELWNGYGVQMNSI